MARYDGFIFSYALCCAFRRAALVPALVFTFTKANVLKWSVSNTIPLTSTDEALAL
jgi:hypothetical protein